MNRPRAGFFTPAERVCTVTRTSMGINGDSQLMADDRQASTLVTGATLAEFNAKAMGIAEKEDPKEAAGDPVVTDPAVTDQVDGAATDSTDAKDPVTEPVKTPEELEAEAAAQVDLTKEEKRKKENQERWQRLANERREAQERARTLEEENRALREKLEPPKPSTKPDPTQFTDMGEYSTALEDWTREQTRQQIEQENRTRTETERAAKVASDWTSRISKTKETVEDFDDVVGQSTAIVSDQVRDAIIESDLGPQILYHLAKNPDEADKMRDMTVMGALRYLGRIEAQLEKKPEPVVPQPAVVAKPSTAPAPITPLKGGSVPDSSDGENLSYADYKAKRQAGKIK